MSTKIHIRQRSYGDGGFTAAWARIGYLRNVALTAPYLHDGSARSLEDAVDIMARNQLGLTLAKQDVGLIVGFLRTLTGEFQGKSLAGAAGKADP